MKRSLTSSTEGQLLADIEPRPVALADAEFTTAALFLGRGDAAVEVVVARCAVRPAASRLKAVWNDRKAGRVAPVLLVADHGKRCALAASVGEEPRVWPDLDRGQVERLCRAALAQPNRHAALRLLASALPEIDSPTPGLRNDGLFAIHQLRHGLPLRQDWTEAQGRALPLLWLRDRQLIQALGFEIRPLPGAASMLVTAGGAQVAVATFLDQSEAAEVASPRFGGLSPVLYALAKADEAKVRYVVVSSGAALRLYTARPGAGVGHRGRTETFAELRLDLLREDQAAYLALLFSPEALSAGGTVEAILEDSRRYATDLGARLRERIYGEVVPRLAEAIFKARGLRQPSPEDLHLTYRMALCVLFRLLFIGYAEDQDLLPFRANEAYRRRALKTKARELLDATGAGGGTGPSDALWSEVCLLFRAVDRGRPEWGIPAYDGGLFSEDPSVSDVGAALWRLTLPEDLFGRAFEALLVDEGPDGRGPVDFRSLGVRDFGTIYEGLLESELSVAEGDLGTDEEGRYRPTRKGETPVVRAGEAYLATTSGVRKATATFFTKSFAVEHLLDGALEPALDAHIARLRALDEPRAGEAFFHFRVADISMGSGHFLVAAIDRVERRLSNYLAERPLPAVTDELGRLRSRAEQALGPLAAGLDLEDAQLLRRQIARRCVYGVDLNQDAVDLARLSIWVHTFVPGLPLSVLDHHIVRGNSLLGVGTMEEAFGRIEERAGPLFRRGVEKALAQAREAAGRLARVSEADAAEVKEARRALEDARKAVGPAAALFDIIAAARLDAGLGRELDDAVKLLADKPAKLPGSRAHAAALKTVEPLEPFHFPLAFPEAFARDRPGFDVIVGNPPWEEATIEEDDFWTRWDPGYQGLPQHERERRRRAYRQRHPERLALLEVEQKRAEALRRALTSGGFPGMGTGDPDTYKAFAWRFWNLCARPAGRIGVVLPRSALAAKGSSEWRRELLTKGGFADLTLLTNKAEWVFDDVEPRYTMALATLAPAAAPVTASAGAGSSAREAEAAAGRRGSIPIRGPFSSLERFAAGVAREPVLVETEAILSGTDTAAFPLLPSEDSAEVWTQLRRSPRLDLNDGRTWRARPFAELHATNAKGVMKFAEERPEGFWPVYKGEC